MYNCFVCVVNVLWSIHKANVSCKLLWRKEDEVIPLQHSQALVRSTLTARYVRLGVKNGQNCTGQALIPWTSLVSPRGTLQVGGKNMENLYYSCVSHFSPLVALSVHYNLLLFSKTMYESFHSMGSPSDLRFPQRCAHYLPTDSPNLAMTFTVTIIHISD